MQYLNSRRTTRVGLPSRRQFLVSTRRPRSPIVVQGRSGGGQRVSSAKVLALRAEQRSLTIPTGVQALVRRPV